MSDEIKFIVGELNKPPYNHKYNLITFDALNEDQLLQILNDVFTEIDPKNRMDIREEEPDQMARRMLQMLRILKYQPPEQYMNNFQQNLVSGQQHIVHPILYWLLSNTTDLKKRAYLAKYLVKLDVPPEILGDADVHDIFDKYQELIEQFKIVHREYETLQNSGFSTQELRRDISAIEEERDLVTGKIERMKQKVGGIANHQAMLASAKALRLEKEREKQQNQQEQDLKASIQVIEQRTERFKTQLQDLRKASLGTTPEGLLQRLEEDVNVNNFLVKEKLPKELTAKQQLVSTLEKVAAQPAMGQQELDILNKKIRALSSEINTLNETKVKEADEDDTSDGKVGKLSFFRQNAAMIRRKKDQTADKLNELRSELSNIQDEIKDRREQLKEYSGEEVLKGEEFKSYINKLRTKSSVYKLKRAQLSELRAEYGVLSRTEEILKSREALINENLSRMEAEKGVVGFRDTQDNLEMVSTMKAEVDEQKGTTLDEMSSMVMELNKKIAERKSRLAPIIKELRPLRQRSQDLTVEYNEKKHTYDSVAAGLDSNMSKLEQDVKFLIMEITSEESNHHILSVEKQILSHRQQQASDEIKLYLQNDPQAKKSSMREQLNGLITEQEKLGRSLREEQKAVKDLAQTSARQLSIWQDIIKLMEVKSKCLESSRNNGGQVMRNSGSEALVL